MPEMNASKSELVPFVKIELAGDRSRGSRAACLVCSSWSPCWRKTAAEAPALSKRTSGRPTADLHLDNPSSCLFDVKKNFRKADG